jgi:hypothetical protein
LEVLKSRHEDRIRQLFMPKWSYLWLSS